MVQINETKDTRSDKKKERVKERNEWHGERSTVKILEYLKMEGCYWEFISFFSFSFFLSFFFWLAFIYLVSFLAPKLVED